MGVRQRLWNRTHIVGMAAVLMVCLIGMSACGAAGAPDGDPAFAMPTDPPAGDGPLPTADEVLEGMVAFMESQQDLAVDAYITFEVLQNTGQLLSFNNVQYLAMSGRIAWRGPLCVTTPRSMRFGSPTAFSPCSSTRITSTAK